MRRLWALIDGLPPDGALGRSLRGARWAPGTIEDLLALQCELLDAQIGMWAKNPRARKPLRIPRPGESKPAKQIPARGLPDAVRARQTGKPSEARRLAEERRERNRLRSERR